MSSPLPDLLREHDGHRPWWRRALYLLVALLCLAAGVAGWLIPVITGLPFYVAAVVFLGLASDRVRRAINRLERRLAEGTRRKLRGAMARLPGEWVRRLIHIPDES
ncbi:MAG TPA: hypothetical protein VEH80_03900 [Candidatus Bathyarchaeia archaeon]|nr:hypothetical protein [Candidatus Bathyarchaeia archaeon]